MTKEKLEPPKPPKPDEKEPEVMVMEKLPQQDVRTLVDNDGSHIKLITIEEALTDIYKRLKNIEKGITT